MLKRTVGPLTARAAFSPGTVNASRRTVDVVWSTGARVLRNSFWDGPSYEELSMDPAHVRLGRLNAGAPFLADHSGSTDSVRGVVESARIENGKGIATVRFPSEGVSPEADKMFALVRDGILQNVSVGYRTYKTEKVGKAEGDVPVFRSVDWEPHEISAVGIGADPDAHFRSDHQTQHECTFVVRNEERMDPEELKKQQAAAEAKRAADEARAEGARIERERVSGIRAVLTAQRITDVEFERSLIDGNVSLEQARAQVLDRLASAQEATATRNTQPAIEVGDTDIEKKHRGMESALLARVANKEDFKAAQKKGFKGFDKIDDGGEYRGMSLVEMARECLELRGVNTRRMREGQILDAILGRASGLAPASDFATMYENALGKILLGAYATAPDTWRAFCKVDSVKDFRASPRYRVGSFGTLDTVKEGEEYKNKSIPDAAKYTITTETRGNIIGLTRQAMIADDMGANADLASRFGRSAGLTIESDVYAFLALNAGLGGLTYDGDTLFHANHSNISTSAAISVAALDADRIKMAQQMDQSSNEYLDLRPSVLLVPVGLGSTARRLNLAEFDNDSTALMKPNVARGLFGTVIDSPRLSGNRRYIFADPSLAPALVVAFLEGTGEAPYMEQHQEFTRDGMSWKLRLDMKVQAGEYKGCVTNAGG